MYECIGFPQKHVFVSQKRPNFIRDKGIFWDTGEEVALLQWFYQYTTPSSTYINAEMTWDEMIERTSLIYDLTIIDTVIGTNSKLTNLTPLYSNSLIPCPLQLYIYNIIYIDVWQLFLTGTSEGSFGSDAGLDRHKIGNILIWEASVPHFAGSFDVPSITFMIIY